MARKGFEPLTPCLKGRCSNQAELTDQSSRETREQDSYKLAITTITKEKSGLKNFVKTTN